MEILEFIAGLLRTVAAVLTVVTLPVFLWQGIVMLFGLWRKKTRRGNEVRGENRGETPDDPLHFAVVVCARNEEPVIGSLLDSLRRQEYPADRFAVYVVADNCTDRTAAVSREKGAAVLERFDTVRVGKGHALRWALPQILEEARFDAVAVFDADNIASLRFLAEMDKALRAGADAAQGYREAMNPRNSWVSGCYGIYWLYMARFFNRSRANMGQSCLVGGTGFVFRAALLENGGWDTVTMSEDTEFSLRQICRGRRIVPVDTAVFYDEQPTSFRVSLRQRYRWMTGCVQCVRRCLPDAFRVFWRGRLPAAGSRPVSALAAWDAMLLLVTPLAAALATFSGVLSVTALLLSPGAAAFSLLLSSLGGLIALWGTAALSVKLEGKSLRAYGRSALLFPLFILPLPYLIIAALIRPGTDWKPITHTGCISALEGANRR